MDFSMIERFSTREREMFGTVCNHLLGHTFVTRLVFQGSKTIHNPEYTFLERHYETVKNYLALMDWSLVKNDDYYYVMNDLEANRLTLKWAPTTVLLALRLIYDENSDRVGLHKDVLCTFRELLHKITITFAIQKPNKKGSDDVKDALKLFEDHNIIVRLDGRFGDLNCSFAILPTIIATVSPGRLEALVTQMKKGELAYEETEQDTTDQLAVL